MGDEAHAARHYPVSLVVEGRLAVIVGGGHSAERRASALAAHGADVVVISSETSDGLRALQAEGAITIEDREYAAGDLEGAFIALCAGCDEETAAQVSAEARERGCLLSAPGAGTRSDFVVPSIVRRGPLQIAVSTDGRAPAVASVIRRQLRDEYGVEWGELVVVIGEVRALMLERAADRESVDAALARIPVAEVLERLQAGEIVDADGLIAEYAPELAETAE